MSKDQADLVGWPTISVITAAFAMERWDGLRQAVASILAQTVPVLETIVVIDHNPDLLDRAQRELPGVVVVPNLRNRGASGTRNSGVAASYGEVVAFLDDDAVAFPSWLEVMLPHFADPDVVGVGCRVVPVWAGSRPRWFPQEFDWAVGASYRGMPEKAAAVRNVWSCGMAVSRPVFDAIGGFRDDFGKVGGRNRPEDTDLSLRAAAARPGGTWVYDPAAVVSHHVPLERATLGYFLRRCLNEGSGKAELAALNGGGQSTSAERLYTRRVLPRGVVRGLRDTVRGDVSGGLRSIAITAGLSAAMAGFAAGRVAGMVHRADLPQVQAGNGQVQHQTRTRAPRILVDQSGYDLLNVGDVAMLQACVIRLRRLWPDAEIMVICHAPERLASYCPGTIAIGRTVADLPFFRVLPRRPRLAAEQAWKMAAPYFSCRFRSGRVRPERPRTAIQAVRAADVVVASGGGYVTDTWWWHAAGVLSLLDLAQRLGKPTAMFGQGVGPIRAGRRGGGWGALRVQARAVLPRLAVLGLREDRTGKELAISLGIPSGAVAVTGDDALELIPEGSTPGGHALGVSMRVSHYADVDQATAEAVGDLVVQAAEAFGAPIVALPVSRYPVDSDLEALRALLRPERSRADIVLHDLATPEALVTAAVGCRVIVSGSYHAAVFGLARGVPAVCLTGSSYYDAKFAGLRALFPGACFVVPLDQPDLAGRLRQAIDQAWHLPAEARDDARSAATRQRDAGRQAYTRFRDAVEKRLVMFTADSRELGQMSAPPAVSPHDGPVPNVSDGFSPALMVEVELTEPLPTVSYDGQHNRAWVLGRLHGEPVGSCVIRLDAAGLAPGQLAALLWPELRGPVADRFAAASLPQPGTLTSRGLAADPAAWPFLRRRRDVLAAAPFISVVVCTRDRADRLEACLRHLARQEYPRFEIVVVDNAPTSDAVRDLVEARKGRAKYRYVVEQRGGLSWARNAGIAAASGDVIAFLDDDEEPDGHWLAGIAGGFARGDDIGCVTGMILPARLDTQIQEWFECSGGHSKGRGFSPAVFSRQDPQSPLFPLPPFGAGGNMAFRREALARIGGFDVAMGAGTPACASEDTLALTLVLLAGYRIAYEPAALVRHDHYAEPEGLRRQLRGYGVGLTAYYTALLRHRPGVLPALLRLLPMAAGYLRGASVTDIAVPQELPAEFRRATRWGMLTGPAAYIMSVRRQARVASEPRR